MANTSKIIIMLIALLILLTPYTLADGLCELNKNIFSPGSLASLICECSSPLEQNEAGFIVWKQENGSILQSTATNSGLCRTSLFGDSIIFPTDISNYNGTVRFSLNADGTGDVSNWDGVGDVVEDNFTVDGGEEIKCIISDLKVPSNVILGKQNNNIFKVTDSLTSNPIVGIGCVAIIFGEDDVPLSVHPYGENYDFYKTVSGGTGYLQSSFSDSSRMQPHTTYEFNLYCQCTNNSENDGICYDDITGERLGYKSCSITGLFTTGEDKRYLLKENNLLSLIISFGLMITFFCIIGFANLINSKTEIKTKNGNKEIFDVSKWSYWAMYTGFSFAVIEAILMLGVIYGTFIESDITLLLKINFWLMLLISLSLFMLTMIMSIINIMLFREIGRNGKKWAKKW